MRAEVVSIGTEITTGRNLDTNSQWLSQRLGEIGIDVAFHTTVSDSLADNVAAIQSAVDRVPLVIITGGLGPTFDDLTREALSKAAGVDLVLHEPSLMAIRAMFAERKRVMPDRNRLQALFPAGSEPIPNSVGTAPGIWMKIRKATVAALPGVPREMTHLFETFVRPRLIEMNDRGRVIIERKLKTFGLGESQVEEKLTDLTARGRKPEVGITASNATISLRIVARAANEIDARAAIRPVEDEIRKRLGILIYGADDEEIQDVICQLLAEKKLTVATAESITAGQVSSLLARVPGASSVLRGGIVAYTNDVKRSVLGVPNELIRQYGAVSESVAQQMAIGCRRLMNCDIGVSTTGLAGPGDGGENKPIGLGYIGLATADIVFARQVQWFGTRLEIQSRMTKSALNIIRLFLLNHITHDLMNT